MKMDLKKIALGGIFGLTAVVSLYFILTLTYWFTQSNVAYLGASVGGVDVSGKDKGEIERVIAAKAAKFQNEKITFVSDKPVTLSAKELSLTADTETTAKNIIAWGKENPFVLGTKKDFPIIFKVNTEVLSKTIGQISDDNSTKAVDPTLNLQNGEVKVSSGNPGMRVNLAGTASNFYSTIGKLGTLVSVQKFSIEPSFSETDAVLRQEEIKRATKNPITLNALENSFTVDQKTLVSWVSPTGPRPVYARIFGDDPLFFPLNGETQADSIFSSQKVSDYLNSISGNVNREPVNAQLAAQNGTVVITRPSVSGTLLNVTESTVTVLTALQNGESGAKLTVEIKKPEVREDNLADLGIKELISTGYTNFAGSPVNRIHNVRTGASKFNGVLIKPGENFSFNTALGPVDASTGYLPELVILENKTKPEFGGGMCQVSSTAFRAALNAGLPILERLYHAYPVSYYKPYGVDATIYLPKPDLVFKNDTGHYILIQTHIDGYKLSFDFYGTKVARTVTFAGNENAEGAVLSVEKITPKIYDQGIRGKGSFTAQFWRFIYDSSGNLTTKSNWVSKYDSPDKYPH